MSTYETIKKILIDQLGVADEELTLDATFRDDLGCDSLDDIELIMAAEEDFGIEIPDEDGERLVRVSDAVAYIDSRLSEKRAEPATSGQRGS